jgi:putative membrane protein
MAVGYWFAPMIFEYNYVVPIYVIFIGLIQYFKYKITNCLSIRFIIKQSGAWDVSNAIVPSKIQAITTSQLFGIKN